MKKYLISIGTGALVGAVVYYVCLPALNLQSVGFWVYLLGILAVIWITFSICVELELQKVDPNYGKKNVVQEANEKVKRLNRQVAILGLLTALPVAVLLLGGLSSVKLFHASRYAGMITVKEADFAADMEEATSVSNIALMDTNSARIIGNRTMGSLSEVVSQYEISGQYSQINYQGMPKKVANLEYAGFLKWLNNKKNGIPGLVMVDPVKNNAEYVKLHKPLRYVESAYFGEDLFRALRFAYPTKLFDQCYFEIDEQGNPYYIVSCLSAHAGLFGAKDVSEVIVFDPCDGSSAIYEVGEVPSWIDIVYSGERACEKYNWYGMLKNGYWNSQFGNLDCKVTTDDYGYIMIGDDVWYFTGVTSIGGDESNIGFIISNARTGEYTFYRVAGAEEYSAMSAAEGEVQEKGYQASFPSLINVSGQATYIMVLKDDGGLVKLYALVNVENYGIVATGSTQAQAMKTYKKLLGAQGVINGQVSDDTKEDTITVEQVRIVQLEETPVVYITAKNGEVYKGFLNADESLILIRQGDTLQVRYAATDVEHIYQIEDWNVQ